MAIYDCFLFFNELDVLEMRMEMMDEYVDYFVIQESTKTFRGRDKPLYFQENKERFKKFHNKIISSVYVDNNTCDNWTREGIQRNHIVDALIKCKDDDILILSELDEFPNMEVNPIQSFYRPNELFHMLQKMYYYYIDVQKDEIWYGTRVCSYSYFKNTTFNDIRIYKEKGIKINNGGWHFSYLGGVDQIKQKLAAISHVEFDNDFIKNNIGNNINNSRDIFNRPDAIFKEVRIDETYPKYLRNNLKKYSHFIKGVYA